MTAERPNGPERPSEPEQPSSPEQPGDTEALPRPETASEHGRPDPTVGGPTLPAAVTPRQKKRRRKTRVHPPPAAVPSAEESQVERPRSGGALPEPTEPVAVTTLTVADCGPADEAELRHLMRQWRRGRATRKLTEVVSDAYVMVFGVLLVVAMVANVVLQAQTTVSACDTAACTAARLFLPWATVAMVAGLALAMARLFGPVLASAAEGAWLMSAPVGRGRLLRPRLAAAVVVALLGGGLLGLLVTLLSGSQSDEVAAWTVASALVTAGVTALAAVVQTSGAGWLTRWGARLFALVGMAVLVLVIALAAGWTEVTLTGVARLEVAVAVAAVGLVMLLVCVVAASLRLNRIPRLRLTSGGSLARGLAGAFYGLDLSLIHDIVVERRAAEKGHVQAMRGSGSGAQALVLRELQKVFRQPAAVPVVLATLVVPYAADALGLSTVAPFLGGLAVFVTLIPLTSGLRVLTRTAGLARTLPFTTGQLRRATVAVPAGVALLWALLAAPAFMGFGDGATERSVPAAVAVSLVTAAAGLMGAVRWTTAKPINWGGPMASTPAGAFPPGLVMAPVRGIDMVLLITAPVLLGVATTWSLAVLAVVAVVLLGGFDSDQLKAQREEQQHQLDQSKARRR